MPHRPVVGVVRTVFPRRAWAVLMILAVSLSIAVPSAVATHDLPGPDPPVNPHPERPGLIPELPVDPPEADAEAWAEGMEDCLDTVLATFLEALAEVDLVGWLHPEEAYCKEEGDRLRTTVDGLENQTMGQVPDPGV